MNTNIPLELRELPQWVGASVNKIPTDPKTGKTASVDDPSTWGTFEQACGCGLPHVGFVFTENDPYVFIDLDTGKKPEMTKMHAEIIEAADSYTETSISGTGSHIVVKAQLEHGLRADSQALEIYPHGRYMLMTGWTYYSERITEGQDLVDYLVKQIGQKRATVVDLVSEPSDLSDEEIWERAVEAKNGDKFIALFNGTWQNYDEYQNDHSRADMAFATLLDFYTRDVEQAVRLFKMSKLYRPEKGRRNGDGADYILRTLKNARAFNQERLPPPVDLDVIAQRAAEVAGSPQEDSPAPSHSPTLRPETLATSELPFPPGLVGDLARYLYSSAIRPVPEVALVSALGVVAGIAGRNYYTSGMPTGLNLYLILLAETGMGKEGGKQGINRLLSDVRSKIPMVSQFIGPTSFASGQALVKRFDEQPCFYSVLDEFGHTLKRITTPKASGAEQALHKELLSLYSHSGPDGGTGVQAYSDREKNTAVVQAPSLTIIGESTPDVFYGCLDSALVQDGLVPRLLVVEYTGKRPPKNRRAGSKPDAMLVERFTDLVTVAINAGQSNRFAKVELSGESEVLLDSFDIECDDHINNGNAAEVQLWNRAHLNALKVASVITVGCCPYHPTVSVEHASWAIEFVRRSVHSVQSRFDKGEVGGGAGAKAESAIRTAFKDFLMMPPAKRATYKTPKAFLSSEVIPYSYLYAKLKRVQPFKTDRRILEETLKTLIEAGVIQQLPSLQVREKFKSQSKAYCVGDCW